MARARDAGPALLVSREADYRSIEQHYRDLIERTAPPEDLTYDPVRIGPVWDWTPERGWLLPDATLGWGNLAWSTYWLTGKGGKPWMWTAEQARILLWYYGLSANEAWVDFLAHTYALQRLKGWGKDPTAAGVSVISLHGPVMFDHWEGNGWKVGSAAIKDWRAVFRNRKRQGHLPSLQAKQPNGTYQRIKTVAASAGNAGTANQTNKSQY